jgi:hypothetical protein
MPDTQTQTEIIARNLARWQQEQERKHAKQDADRQEAARRGLTLSQLKEFRREGWLRRNCRATIQQLIDANPSHLKLG